MAQLSSKLRNWKGDGKEGLFFWCPGCNSAHTIRLKPDGWGWNTNLDRPTFTPSVLVTYGGKDAGQGDAPPAICHSFVTDGMIQFLGDSTHALAGQTVELPDFPPHFKTD